jgi:hypothetical protein
MGKKGNRADIYLGDKKAGLLEKTEKGYRFTYRQFQDRPAWRERGDVSQHSREEKRDFRE